MFNLATEPAFNKVFSTSVLFIQISLFSNVMLSLHRAVTGTDACRRPWLKGLSDCRSWFWQGGERKKTHGEELWSYLHNCKVKAILGGGNKEPSVCWAVPFGPGEILSAATSPPILPLKSITTAGQGGQSVAPMPHPTAPQTLLWFNFSIYMEDKEETNTYCKISGVNA